MLGRSSVGIRRVLGACRTALREAEACNGVPMTPGKPGVRVAVGGSAIIRRFLPYCAVTANTSLPADFATGLGKYLAEVLDKPEKLMTVSVRPGTTMVRGGSEEPNAVVEIWSVGVFDAERNPYYTRKIYDYLLPRLNMPADRIAIFFHPIELHAAGHLLYAGMQK